MVTASIVRTSAEIILIALVLWGIQDYIRFRVKTAKESVTRDDCGECKKKRDGVVQSGLKGLADIFEALRTELQEVAREIVGVETEILHLKEWADKSSFYREGIIELREKVRRAEDDIQTLLTTKEGRE